MSLTNGLFRVNVFSKSHHQLDHKKKKILEATSLHSVKSLSLAKSYFISGDYSLSIIKKIAVEILHDPILETYSINELPCFPPSSHYQIEIGLKPGVVDNEARTIQIGIKDLLGNRFDPHTKILTVRAFTFGFKSDPLDKNRLLQIAQNYLFNPLIEKITILDDQTYREGQENYRSGGWKKEMEVWFQTPDHPKKYYETIPLTRLMEDEQKMIEFSKRKLLFLNPDEMRAIFSYFSQDSTQARRQEKDLPTEPTDVELEVLAQTWSEHCKHKIFAAKIEYREKDRQAVIIDSLYQTHIKATTREIMKKRTDLISVFTDNAGIFSFTKDQAICMKVETHNSPSALDPFGGAITGILGVNRDIMGTGIGAETLFNTDIFCFANPFYDKKMTGSLLHPQRIFKGVHHGVERGGNESGIPTVNGAMVFDDRFLGKPLVFCGTGGIIPQKITWNNQTVSTQVKEIWVGDLIVVAGGRVGKDGIHGATFSSEKLEADAPTSVVQIGDSIMQKKMADFLIQARNRLLYRTITDNGAGGLSSSVGELATLVKSDHGLGGCEIHLDRHLAKYPGLKPWEILISESQERMTLAVPPDHRSELIELADRYEVELSFIGTFTDSGYLSAYFQNEIVADLKLDFLHQGVPQLQLKANWSLPEHEEPCFNNIKLSYGEALKKILARPNVASKEFWVRQYDHEVKAISILKPFDGIERDAPMDAAVIKPIPNSRQGLVIANGIIPRYSDIDTYHMASAAVDEALRNLVATGGDPQRWVALDNFCWPDPIASPDNPDGAYKLAQLVRANQALKETCLAYDLPLISGKDSMKNDYGEGESKISVPPTLLITALTVIDDIQKICTSYFKKIGSSLYLVGETKNELGASEFFAQFDWIGNKVPKVDHTTNGQIYKKLHQAIKKEIILACHDLSDGGLGVALAESCFGRDIGVEIEMNRIPIHQEQSRLTKMEINWIRIFSESQGRFILELNPDMIDAEEKLLNCFKKLPIYKIGVTRSDDEMIFKQESKIILQEKTTSLKKIWKQTLIF